MLEKKLQEELNRYNQINNYNKRFIMEQEAPLAQPPTGDIPMDAPAAPELPPIQDAKEVAPEMDNVEEVDITDLVNMTKNIKRDFENAQDNSSQVMSKMDDVFTKLDDLSQKLQQMDVLLTKIDELGSKIDEVKPDTPEEKLEMRSLDSYPFNQKPRDFFSQKQEEMRSSGKNEYILTKNDVENMNIPNLKDTFADDISDRY